MASESLKFFNDFVTVKIVKVPNRSKAPVLKIDFLKIVFLPLLFPGA